MLINNRPKTTMISSLLVDGNVVTKPEKIADSMNKYFRNIGEQLKKDIPYKLKSFLSNQIHAPDRSFIFTSINTEHIIKAISKFRSSRGFGLDNISSFFLKKGSGGSRGLRALLKQRSDSQELCVSVNLCRVRRMYCQVSGPTFKFKPMKCLSL